MPRWTRLPGVCTASKARRSATTLLLAVGARQVADLDHALTFRDAEARRIYEEVVQGVEQGGVDSVASSCPTARPTSSPPTSWPC